MTLENIVFGGAALSGKGGGYGLSSLKDCTATQLIKHSYELGIRYFDFAPIYGFNQAEIEMGNAMGADREKYKLISKAGVDWHDNRRVNMSNDPKIIRKMFDQSLKNFNCDYLDIYFIHWPDKNVDIRYSLEVLQNLKEKNKIKHIGLSNTNFEEFELGSEVASIEFLQNECNLFAQKVFTHKDTISMGWGSFDKGILTSSVKANSKFEKSDARSHAFWWKKSNWKQKVEFVEQIKKKYEINDYQLKSVAYNFSLSHVDLPIIGINSLAYLNELLTLNQFALDNKELTQKVCDEFTLF